MTKSWFSLVILAATLPPVAASLAACAPTARPRTGSGSEPRPMPAQSVQSAKTTDLPTAPKPATPVRYVGLLARTPIVATVTPSASGGTTIQVVDAAGKDLVRTTAYAPSGAPGTFRSPNGEAVFPGRDLVVSVQNEGRPAAHYELTEDVRAAIPGGQVRTKLARTSEETGANLRATPILEGPAFAKLRHVTTEDVLQMTEEEAVGAVTFDIPFLDTNTLTVSMNADLHRGSYGHVEGNASFNLATGSRIDMKAFRADKYPLLLATLQARVAEGWAATKRRYEQEKDPLSRCDKAVVEEEMDRNAPEMRKSSLDSFSVTPKGIAFESPVSFSWVNRGCTPPIDLLLTWSTLKEVIDPAGPLGPYSGSGSTR